MQLQLKDVLCRPFCPNALIFSSFFAKSNKTACNASTFSGGMVMPASPTDSGQPATLEVMTAQPALIASSSDLLAFSFAETRE